MPPNIVIAIDDPSNIDAWGLRPKSPVAWSAGAYAKGTVVTHSGQVWLAQAQTSQTPGVGADWESLIPNMTGAAGAMFGQGDWNAATNTPALASGVGTKGYFWRVSVAGTTSIDGIAAWEIGDLIWFDGSVYRKGQFGGPSADVVEDANKTATAAMRVVSYAALTAARIVSLPAASVFQAGQPLVVIDESGNCSASNTITISCDGSDTVNGAASFILRKPYAGVLLIRVSSTKWTALPFTRDFGVQNANKVFAGPTNGTDADPAFRALVVGDLPAGAWTKLATLTASNSANLSDTTSFTSDYDEYEIVLENILPVDDGANLKLELHIGGFWMVDGYSSLARATNSVGPATSHQTTYIDLSGATTGRLKNSGGVGLCGQLRFFNPAETANAKRLVGQTAFGDYSDSGKSAVAEISASRTTTTDAVTGMKFYMDSGNIANGNIRIFGRKK